MASVSRLSKAPFSATFKASSGAFYPSALSGAKGLENGWKINGASVIPPTGETRFRVTVQALTGAGSPTVSVRRSSGTVNYKRAIEYVDGAVLYFAPIISSMADGDTGIIIVELL